MRDNFLLETKRIFKVPSSSCWLFQAGRDLVLMASYASIRGKGNGILMTAPPLLHWQDLSLSACSAAVGVVPELLGGMHISVTHNAGSLQMSHRVQDKACWLSLFLLNLTPLTLCWFSFLPCCCLLHLPCWRSWPLLPVPASSKRAVYFYCQPIAGPWLTPRGHQHIATAPVLKQSCLCVAFVNFVCGWLSVTLHFTECSELEGIHKDRQVQLSGKWPVQDQTHDLGVISTMF